MKLFASLCASALCLSLSHRAHAGTAFDGDWFRADARLQLESAVKTAVAVWVTEAGKPEPIQAAGGLL